MLQTIEKTASSTDIAAVLLEEGGVIVASQIDVETLGRIKADLRPHFDEQGLRFTSDFNGYKTRRLGKLCCSRTSSWS